MKPKSKPKENNEGSGHVILIDEGIEGGKLDDISVKSDEKTYMAHTPENIGPVLKN